MPKKNFMSYGDSETIFSEYASKIKDNASVWTGKREEWNALSEDEQAKYSIVNFTDDPTGGDMVVVDEVTSGNMNPVTSNAVASILNSKTVYHRVVDSSLNFTSISELCDVCINVIEDLIANDSSLNSNASIILVRVQDGKTISIWLCGNGVDYWSAIINSYYMYPSDTIIKIVHASSLYKKFYINMTKVS